MMAFNGVRSSWPILAMNSLLARPAATACCSAAFCASAARLRSVMSRKVQTEISRALRRRSSR